MKKLFGITIIIVIFLAIFLVITYTTGFFIAVSVFSLAMFVTWLLIFAIKLID